MCKIMGFTQRKSGLPHSCLREFILVFPIKLYHNQIFYANGIVVNKGVKRIRRETADFDQAFLQDSHVSPDIQ